MFLALPEGMEEGRFFLPHDFMHYTAVHVGRTQVAAGEAVGESLVIDSEEI